MDFDMDIEEMEEAMAEGMLECKCCGEMIELDGVCPEGTQSPFLTYGFI